MIVISGVIEMGEKSVDAAIEAASIMAAATREEDGCLAYAFYQDVENPCRFRVFEEWRDADALARHFEAPHMATFRAALAGLEITRREIKKYSVSEVGAL